MENEPRLIPIIGFNAKLTWMGYDFKLELQNPPIETRIRNLDNLKQDVQTLLREYLAKAQIQVSVSGVAGVTPVTFSWSGFKP